MSCLLKIFCLVAFCLLVVTGKAFSLDVFIMSSSSIIPYSSCVEGIEDELSKYSLKFADIKEDLERGSEFLLDIREKSPKVLIAVGPQAGFAMSKEPYFSPRIFCILITNLVHP